MVLSSEGAVAQWFIPLTFQPKQSSKESLIPQGVVSYPIIWGCVPVSGGFWQKNSGNGVYTLKKNSGIRVKFLLKILGIPRF